MTIITHLFLNSMAFQNLLEIEFSFCSSFAYAVLTLCFVQNERKWNSCSVNKIPFVEAADDKAGSYDMMKIE